VTDFAMGASAAAELPRDFQLTSLRGPGGTQLPLSLRMADAASCGSNSVSIGRVRRWNSSCSRLWTGRPAPAAPRRLYSTNPTPSAAARLGGSNGARNRCREAGLWRETEWTKDTPGVYALVVGVSAYPFLEAGRRRHPTPTASGSLYRRRARRPGCSTGCAARSAGRTCRGLVLPAALADNRGTCPLRRRGTHALRGADLREPAHCDPGLDRQRAGEPAGLERQPHTVLLQRARRAVEPKGRAFAVGLPRPRPRQSGLPELHRGGRPARVDGGEPGGRARRVARRLPQRVLAAGLEGSERTRRVPEEPAHHRPPLVAASLASTSPNAVAYQMPGHPVTFFGQAVLEALGGSAAGAPPASNSASSSTT